MLMVWCDQVPFAYHLKHSWLILKYIELKLLKSYEIVLLTGGLKTVKI